MPRASDILYFLVHPRELRSIIQWKVWHEPVHVREPEKEDPTLRECFKYLNMTSRSFSAVIQELHPELLVPVCLFYLVLRGLDTVEDDMTVPAGTKDSVLRSFHNNVDKEGWTWDGSGPDEKDRDLLIHFDCVTAEFRKMKKPYQVIIRDITKRMGNGMADFAELSASEKQPVKRVADYELYCHYVAGLVGEGLTRLFVESGLALKALLEKRSVQSMTNGGEPMGLYESMGQFLQQTNIIRDIREDFDDNRRFWPTEVWSKHVDKFEDLFKPENQKAALNCSSEMVLLALRRVDECLFYLAGIRDQSVFNFCAIPQAMAIATLELCFRNPAMFERNIKIKKGDTCALMTKSTQNLQVLCQVFVDYARRIHKKNEPEDPNFLAISVAVGKIEQFVETIFPTQRAPVEVTSEDATKLTKSEKQLAREDAERAEAKEDVKYMLIAVFLVLFFISSMMILFAYLAGARFDLAFQKLTTGWASATRGNDGPDIVEQMAHGEL